MPDIFNDIMQESGKSKSSEKSSNIDDLGGTSVVDNAKPSTSKSSDANPKKGTRDKNSSSKSGTQDSIEKLSEIMASGFQNLQLMLGTCMGQNPNEYEMDHEDLVDDVDHSEQIEGADLFQEVNQEIVDNDKLGNDVVPSLALLANNLLSKKLEATDDIFKNYLKPGNVEFVNTPQINKPIWNSLSHSTKGNDVILQSIQKDFLHSTLPIFTVMEKLQEARDNPAGIDVKELVRGLADGLACIGSANVGMVRLRRANIKKELPHNMQLLCSDTVDFSGQYLFGNSLSSDIKEVSELNKITQSLRGSFRGRSRFRGYPRAFRGRWPFFRPTARGRVAKPYVPNVRRSAPNRRFPLNRRRPSSQ